MPAAGGKVCDAAFTRRGCKSFLPRSDLKLEPVLVRSESNRDRNTPGKSASNDLGITLVFARPKSRVSIMTMCNSICHWEMD